jgi:hypothetical protein
MKTSKKEGVDYPGSEGRQWVRFACRERNSLHSFRFIKLFDGTKQRRLVEMVNQTKENAVKISG